MIDWERPDPEGSNIFDTPSFTASALLGRHRSGMGAEPLGRTAESTFGRRPETPGSRGGTHATVTGEVSRSAYYQFAAYNGTAPIEVSSGSRVTHRLSRRGYRQLNHAIHMVAICQIRQTDSEGRAYFEKKVMEGKTKKDAIRSLKR